jgi:hypothetical protein
MTAQIHEELILEGKKTSMAFCPPIPTDHPKIKTVSEEEMLKKPGIFFSTACWRRYQGTWELKDGKFYLVKLEGRYKLNSWTRVFADWVTAVLRIPEGELLHYVHMGFGLVYEFERHIKLENGIVVDERVRHNRKKDSDSLELRDDNLPGSENNFDGDDL